jgi:hypothetical protein
VPIGAINPVHDNGARMPASGQGGMHQHEILCVCPLLAKADIRPKRAAGFDPRAAESQLEISQRGSLAVSYSTVPPSVLGRVDAVIE